MNKTNFLHNHPDTERRLGLDENHVIIDRDAWEYTLNLPNINGKLTFSANDIDGAYLLGIFNTSGLDGLSKELDRLKKLKINLSIMLSVLKQAKL